MDKHALTKLVWGAMFDLLTRTAPERTQSLARRGLTPNDSRALMSLDVRDGKPMRALAEAWDCDPSYTTWIVDRLERLGLAARRPAPQDRRVKLIVLTKKGDQIRRQLMEEFHRPPAELSALGRQDLEVLNTILTKLGAQTRDEEQIKPD